jgi:hypothetical protein
LGPALPTNRKKPNKNGPFHGLYFFCERFSGSSEFGDIELWRMKMKRTVTVLFRETKGDYPGPEYFDSRQAAPQAAEGREQLLPLLRRQETQRRRRSVAGDGRQGPAGKSVPGHRAGRRRFRPSQQRRSGSPLNDAINIYMTTGNAAAKDWTKHTRQCYSLALRLFAKS